MSLPLSLRTATARSALMRRVGRENTAAELAVHGHLHRAGLRFRVDVRGLPGTPDIVLPKWSTVVFVNGCFWRGHSCRGGRIRAKTNAEYWESKIAANKARGLRKLRELRLRGWNVERV